MGRDGFEMGVKCELNEGEACTTWKTNGSSGEEIAAGQEKQFSNKILPIFSQRPVMIPIRESVKVGMIFSSFEKDTYTLLTHK